MNYCMYRKKVLSMKVSPKLHVITIFFSKKTVKKNKRMVVLT